MKTATHCKYCAAGVKLIKGEHWIVKSILRPSIKIVPCPLAKKKPTPPHPQQKVMAR